MKLLDRIKKWWNQEYSGKLYRAKTTYEEIV